MMKMGAKIQYLLYMLLTTVLASKRENLCDITSNDTSKFCFRKEIIASLSHSPNQLAVDKTTNYLYFSFDSGQGEYIPAKVKIGGTSIVALKGVKDAFAMASDNKTGEMYFGGSHGIYRYNPRMKKLKRMAVDNLDIWWLVIRDIIYFIKFPSLNAYKYENKTIRHMPELKGQSIHQFTFDPDGNIFFINNTGLYGIKSGSNQVILVTDYPRFLGMATDNDGTIYLCSEDGIFTLTRVVQKLRRVITLQGVLGITFDRDNNIIYSDSHDLVRLLRMNSKDYYISTS